MMFFLTTNLKSLMLPFIYSVINSEEEQLASQPPLFIFSSGG